MTPLIVEGVTLHYVQSTEGFDCDQCALKRGNLGCVRIARATKELFFETQVLGDGLLFCINNSTDIVFINDTPEDIARYVAARLEST
jgi:hypothetical protein